MERLSEHTSSGMNAGSLRRWGFFFLAVGLLGQGLIQTHLLGFRDLTMEQMLTRMSQSGQVMTLATISLVLQATKTCAAPIFALLLVERVHKGQEGYSYLGKLLVLALICELPYNLAMGGKLWMMESRNPVFALVLSLVMLLFYQRYSAPGFRSAAVKLVVTLAALLWGGMLRIDDGAAFALITSVLWLLRNKPMYRGYAGMAVAVTCTVFSTFYLAAPMGFLVAHGYNGEMDEESLINYAVYPLLLAAVAGAGYVLPRFL